jgi:hypothetical protein
MIKGVKIRVYRRPIRKKDLEDVNLRPRNRENESFGRDLVWFRNLFKKTLK